MSLSSATISDALLGISVVIVLAVILSFMIARRVRRSVEDRWKMIQKLLVKKSSWKAAIINADKLLDEVLKKRRFKGKTMGERLVSAQHELTANDMVWFSHKLCNKIIYEGTELSKTDVKKALLGFWQALKDLGAFKKDNK